MSPRHVFLSLAVTATLAAPLEAQPAHRIADLNPGTASSYPKDFHEIRGFAYFMASGAGNELWRTDGTEAGTILIRRGFVLNSGVAATTRALFWLEYPNPNFTLTMSDGTSAGTGPVPVPADVIIFGVPVCAGGRVYFPASRNPVGPQLWVSDGTAAGTLPLGTFQGFGSLIPFHDRLAFLATPTGGGTELWITDGTPVGTARVKPLTSQDSPPCPGVSSRLGRFLIFLANDGVSNCNLWRSDGTPTGTVAVAPVGPNAFLVPIASARGFLAFQNRAEVWRTDGTTAGTYRLNMVPGGTPGPGVGTREGVFFPIYGSAGVYDIQQLWFTDGSYFGTRLLHDFRAGGEAGVILSVTSANGRLLMDVWDSKTESWSLWTSDGTVAGTVPVQSGVGASGLGFPYRGMTLFAGGDSSTGAELWAIDGAVFAPSPRESSFFVSAPCRLVDTRLASDFLGGPAIQAGATRVFPVGGVCGIPWTARALAVNVTVTEATADGILRIHASDVGAPETSVINFRGGQARANNAMIALSGDAEMTVRYETATDPGNVHVIVDVVGWYE